MGPVGGDIGIMCPFEHPAFDDDLATQPYVNLSAKFKSGTSTLSACDFSMDDPLYASFGLGGIPAAGHSGVAIGGGYVFMPLLTTSGPAGMRLSCTLTNGSTIGSIEMDLDY
jgi:hypothetical protein